MNYSMTFLACLLGYCLNGSAQIVEQPFVFVPSNGITTIYQNNLQSFFSEAASHTIIHTSSYFYDSLANKANIITILTSSPVTYTPKNCLFLSRLNNYSNSQLLDTIGHYWAQDSVAIILSEISYSKQNIRFEIKNCYFHKLSDSTFIKEKINASSEVFRIHLQDVSVKYKKFESKKYSAQNVEFTKYGFFIYPDSILIGKKRSRVTDSVQIKANATGVNSISVFLPLSWLQNEFSNLFQINDQQNGIALRLINNKITYKKDSVQVSSELYGQFSSRNLLNRYLVKTYWEPTNFLFQDMTAEPKVMVNKPESILVKKIVKDYTIDLKGKVISLFNMDYPITIRNFFRDERNIWLKMDFCALTPNYLIITNEIHEVQKMQ